MERNALTEYLNSYLEVEKFRDYCPKGMVIEGSEDVKKVITAVSFCEELVDIAEQESADMLIVHHPHGFWDNQKKLPIGSMRRKLLRMLKNNISLLAYHLPLDAHPEVGNNVELIHALGMKPIFPFMKYNGAFIGWAGEFPHTVSLDVLTEKVTGCIGKPVYVSEGVKRKISRVGVCSGGAPEGVIESLDLGLDAYITGESREHIHHFAKEEQIHYLACGHHNTEVFGPRALADHIRKNCPVEVKFVDIPNPL